MDISNFDDLLMAARAQPEPQRLLFVFAGAELPDDATPEQRAHFEQGEGGALVPVMCVDKAIGDLTSFPALVDESREMGQSWQIVFAAALSGTATTRKGGTGDRSVAERHSRAGARKRIRRNAGCRNRKTER